MLSESPQSQSDKTVMKSLNSMTFKENLFTPIHQTQITFLSIMALKRTTFGLSTILFTINRKLRTNGWSQETRVIQRPTLHSGVRSFQCLITTREIRFQSSRDIGTIESVLRSLRSTTSSSTETTPPRKRRSIWAMNWPNISTIATRLRRKRSLETST